jgi:hypothetical protein
MPRSLAFLGLLLPVAAGAQPLLTGSTTVVNAGVGDQIDPHVDCNLASYTDAQAGDLTIRYFDFTTSTDAAISTDGLAFLSDVNGSRVVFTQVSMAGSQVVVHDTQGGTSVTIPGGTQRSNATLGGSRVAFEDRAFSANPLESEIVVYDLATGTTARITNDALMDLDPVVTPTGDAVVFQKCLTTGLGCDIHVATQSSPTSFTSSALTGAGGEETNADTNGTVVVYESLVAGEADIAYVSLAGGTPTTLAIPNAQRNPSVSGNLIAFESMSAEGNFDIFVYDMATSTLYRLTQTPVDESLNDITVCGGNSRVVYSAPGASGDFDVFAFTFTVPSPPDDCEEQTPVEACENPGDRPLLATLTLTRTRRQPNHQDLDFYSPGEKGLVCIFNNQATSGEVRVNGHKIAGPKAFKQGTSLIAREFDDLREGENELCTEIAGSPGTSYTVRVYGVNPACEADEDEGGCPGRDDDDDDLQARGSAREQSLQRAAPGRAPLSTTTVVGQSLTFVGDGIRMANDPNDALDLEGNEAVGCEAGAGGVALSALAVLGLWLMSRRERGLVRTRR